MDQFAKHKDEIEKQIVDESLSSYEKGEIREADIREISEFTLKGMKQVTDQASLISFLKQLAFNWSMFTELMKIEEGKIDRIGETQAAQEMVSQIKSGNINEALDTAKEALKS